VSNLVRSSLFEQVYRGTDGRDAARERCETVGVVFSLHPCGRGQSSHFGIYFDPNSSDLKITTITTTHSHGLRYLVVVTVTAQDTLDQTVMLRASVYVGELLLVVG